MFGDAALAHEGPWSHEALTVFTTEPAGMVRAGLTSTHLANLFIGDTRVVVAPCPLVLSPASLPMRLCLKSASGFLRLVDRHCRHRIMPARRWPVVAPPAEGHLPRLKSGGAPLGLEGASRLQPCRGGAPQVLPRKTSKRNTGKHGPGAVAETLVGPKRFQAPTSGV